MKCDRHICFGGSHKTKPNGLLYNKQSMALLKLEDISEASVYIFVHFVYPKQFSKKPTKIANPGP